MRFINSAVRRIRKSRTAEQSCPVRKDVCSRKRKISIRKPITLRKKRTLSTRG